MKPSKLSSCFWVLHIFLTPSRDEARRFLTARVRSSSFSEIVPSVPDDHEETGYADIGWHVYCFIKKKSSNDLLSVDPTIYFS